MPESERRIRTFLIDTNVFVVAIKSPRKETVTLRFFLALLERDDLKLVGNEYWIEELVRYAEEFQSQTAAELVAGLVSRARLVKLSSNFVKVASRYVTTPNAIDILHAATCLQEGAILISNDKHFNRIRDEGVIEVWSTTRAIRTLSIHDR